MAKTKPHGITSIYNNKRTQTICFYVRVFKIPGAEKFRDATDFHGVLDLTDAALKAIERPGPPEFRLDYRASALLELPAPLLWYGKIAIVGVTIGVRIIPGSFRMYSKEIP